MVRAGLTQDKPWSMKQVRLAAGVTISVMYSVLRAVSIDPKNLTSGDVIVLRVGAALLEAPRPLSQSRLQSADITQTRNQAAVALVRAAIEDADTGPQVTLLVFPTEAALVKNTARLNVALDDRPGVTYLGIPVGSWISEFRNPTRHRPRS